MTPSGLRPMQVVALAIVGLTLLGGAAFVVGIILHKTPADVRVEAWEAEEASTVAGEPAGILVTLANLGEADGKAYVAVRDQGRVVGAAVAHVEGGSTALVRVEVDLERPGNRTLALELDNRTVSTSASPLRMAVLRPAALVLQSFALDSPRAVEGGTVGGRVTVRNDGDVAGEAPFLVKVGSVEVASGRATVEPKGVVVLSVTFPAPEPGRATVAAHVAGQSASATVEVIAPDAFAREALARLSRDLAQGGGAIRAVQGTVSPSGVAFRLALGQGDALEARAERSGHAKTWACRDGRGVEAFGGTVYERRDQSFCRLGGLPEAFTLAELRGLAAGGPSSAVLAPDGVVRARLAVADGAWEVEVSPGGRVASAQVARGGSTATLRFEEGPRTAVQVPAAQVRIPADVAAEGRLVDGVYRWTVKSAEADLSVAEFVVELQRQSNGQLAVQARFPLDGPSYEQQGSYVFTRLGLADGVLGPGDGFTLGVSGGGRLEGSVSVVDAWAGAILGAPFEGPPERLDQTPLPGLPWLLAALVLVAAGLRRRRRAGPSDS